MHKDQLQVSLVGRKTKAKKVLPWASGALLDSWLHCYRLLWFFRKGCHFPPFCQNWCSTNGKGTDCLKSSVVKATPPLNLLPHTWIIPPSLLPHTQRMVRRAGPQGDSTVSTHFFNLACRHVKLKLLEPTHLSKGFWVLHTKSLHAVGPFRGFPFNIFLSTEFWQTQGRPTGQHRPAEVNVLSSGPVQAKTFGKHDCLQVLVFFFFSKPLLLKESHEGISLLHHFKHFIQDPLFLWELLICLQMIYREIKNDQHTHKARNTHLQSLKYSLLLSPSTAILSRSSCCSRLCLSSSSSSRALKGKEQKSKFQVY